MRLSVRKMRPKKAFPGKGGDSRLVTGLENLDRSSDLSKSLGQEAKGLRRKRRTS